MPDKNLPLVALKGLSPGEQKLALEILKQVSETGSSDLLNELEYGDFEEIPVDIDTFLDDPRYLGRGLWEVDPVSGTRRCTLFPYWRAMLKKLFPTKTTTAYNTLILTGCLGYDTPIPLLNGKTIAIGDLAKEEKLDEYVYSYDTENNTYVPGHLIAAFSTGVKPVYKIVLNNGTEIKATSNHKFMTRDKRWKSIDSGLSCGDSLMPFNRTTKEVTKNRGGYEVIQNPNKNGTSTDVFTHRLVMQWKLGNYKGVVHHKDFNKHNNDPRNLLLTDWMSHRMYHAKRGGDQFKAFNEKRRLGLISEDVKQRLIAGGLRGLANRWADPTTHEKASQFTTQRMLNGLAKEMSDVVWHGENAAKNRQRVAENFRKANQDKNHIKQYQVSKAIKIGSLALQDFGVLTKETYEQTKLAHNMRTGYPSFDSILKRISLDELIIQASNYNHKVVAIEFVGYEEVYDLTVEKYHNFAIDNGVVAHNSIGIGKTLIGCVALLYMLHRLLCLKDPYAYYGMQPIDKITISLLNITIENAKGVGWDKLNQLAQSSEWFMEHGSLSASKVAPAYRPDKKIELVFGSSNRQVVGRALFCLAGDTEILTHLGVQRLDALCNKKLALVSLGPEKEQVTSAICTVVPTIQTRDALKITLEDGSVITCTKNHKFLLKDGTYKVASQLTEQDELADAPSREQTSTYFNFIDSIIKTRGQWSTELRKTYCERHHIIPKCVGGDPKKLSWDQHPNIIWLTAAEHFTAHKLLALENPENDKLVSAYKRMCYTKDNKYIATAEDFELVRKTWGKAHSLALSGKKLSPDVIRRRKETYSTERKQKLSARFSGAGNNMFGHGNKIAGEKNGGYGRPVEQERLDKIKKARSKYVYIFDNKKFFGWVALQTYLKSIGYNISQAGIESCVRQTGGRIIALYPTLYGRIQKRLKEDTD